MASSAEGWIFYNDVSYSKGLHRFIEKQLVRWAGETGISLIHRELPSGMMDPWYRVSFEKQGLGKNVSCRIELLLGEQVWAGLETGPSADSALVRALQRLTPVSTALPTPSWVHFGARLPKAG
jgi:hypothetical protein